MNIYFGKPMGGMREVQVDGVAVAYLAETRTGHFYLLMLNGPRLMGVRLTGIFTLDTAQNEVRKRLATQSSLLKAAGHDAG